MAAAGSRSALDLVEEATAVLRRAPILAWTAYYVGTLPFLLAFLFFWADMGRSSTAEDHAAPAALGVAILFLWMSVWQGVFSQQLRSTLTGSRPASFWKLALVQSALQPTKFIAVPVALLITIPLATVFGFYQNLGAVSYEESSEMRKVFASARRQARLWQTQNWLVLGFVTVLALLVLVNVGVFLLLVPQALKTFFGFETSLSRGELLTLNTTFLAITVAMTYAIVDPLIKAIYVVRCFYGESLSTGEDLRAQIKSIAAKVAVPVLLLFCLGNGYAQERALDRSIDDVLKRPEFSWRLPHKHQNVEKNWISRGVADLLDKLDQWSDQFARWLHDHFGNKSVVEPGRHALPRVSSWAYWLLGALALVLLVLSIAMFRRRPKASPVPSTSSVVPDLASEHTTADQLPPDEWLRTARECVSRNDLRLAVRALYLANLAYLGRRSFIAIDRSKSNNDYARELRRRARSKPELLPVFSETVGVFERSWYGMYDVDAAQVEQLEQNLTTTRAVSER